MKPPACTMPTITRNYPSVSIEDVCTIFDSWWKAFTDPEVLASMIASDQFFSVNPSAAYAEAWAFTFFLVENEPQKYAQYLALTASKPPFSQYSADQRTADFTSVFGSNWRMLEAQFLRFMKGIK